jgi:hypothetical protein
MFRRAKNTGAAPPKREGRAARVVRWAGTVVCVVAALLFAASLFCVVTWYDGTVWHVGYGRGALGAAWIDYEEEAIQNPRINIGRVQRGLAAHRPWKMPITWWPDAANEGSPTFCRRVVVPLWIPFALAAVPTALLWRAQLRRRRRARVGLCPACGYDRAGIAPDAACPECGEVPTRG